MQAFWLNSIEVEPRTQTIVCRLIWVNRPRHAVKDKDKPTTTKAPKRARRKNGK